MGIVGLDKSVSLDGYITGPNPGPDNPLGDGGDRVFGWMLADSAESSATSDQSMLSEAYDEVLGDVSASTGAVIMGKRMFEIIDGPDGWVAPDGTAFTWPVFVLTHEVRAPVTKGKTAFTFVNDGVESALVQAKAVASDENIGLGARTSPSNSSGRGCWTRSAFTSCQSSWAVACACSITSAFRRGNSSTRAESKSLGSPICGFDSRKVATTTERDAATLARIVAPVPRQQPSPKSTPWPIPGRSRCQTQ